MMKILKKHLVLTVLLAVSSLLVKAQAHSASHYVTTVDSSANLLTDYNGFAINMDTATNLVANLAANQKTSLQPIGFDFFFMGGYYSHFIAGTNGQLALAIATSPSRILSPANPNMLTRAVKYPPTGIDSTPLLAPFWDSLITAASGATIRSVVTGTAPNRCCVVEWNVIINNPASVNPPYSQFQLRLYEKTGAIEFVYGDMHVAANASVVSASIGFTYGDYVGDFLALKSLTNPQFTIYPSEEFESRLLVNSSAEGNITFLHSPNEGSRKRFRFVPPVTNPPVFTSLQLYRSGGTGATLKWTSNFTNILNFAIYKSTDSINFTYAGSARWSYDTFTVTGLTPGTNYYFKVAAVTEGYALESNMVSTQTQCSMAGLYTIGSTGDFRNIQSAFNMLSVLGMSGNVIFELQSNYGSSFNESFPVKFPKMNAACNGYKATLRPAPGVTNLAINPFSYTPSFVLNGVDYLIVDGRPGGAGNTSAITITGAKPTGIFALSNSSGNEFRYIRLTSTEELFGSSAPLVTIQADVNGASNNNKFENCDFFGESVYSPKPVLFFSGGTANNPHSGNSITGCNFYNFSKSAIYISPGNDSWTISGSSFYSTSTVFSYSDTVAVVRIITSGNSQGHVLYQNYFGGTKPHAQGAPMDIYFKTRFYWTDITGKADARNNFFARINFLGGNVSGERDIRFINISNLFSPYPVSAEGNIIGGVITADSVHINCPGNGVSVSCISVGGTSYSITKNSIKRLQCYGGNFTSIALKPICNLYGTGIVKNNEVGSEEHPGIVNYAAGEFIGIWSYLATCVISDNKICNVYADQKGDNAGFYGMYINGGFIDSIYRNKIFNLRGTSEGSWQESRCTGIAAYPHTGLVSPVHNLIEGNSIYNINRTGRLQPDFIAGIRGFTNLQITGNFIHAITGHNLSGVQIHGIYINSDFGSGSIQNNMISLGLDSNGRSLRDSNVVFTGISGGDTVLHNSVYIGGDSVLSTQKTSTCYSLLPNTVAAKVYNNIFYNARSNKNAPAAPLHRCIATNVPLQAGNNLYYFTGTGGTLGNFQGNNINTLPVWQIATVSDNGSLFADPLFTAPAAGQATNLHAAYSSPAEHNGTNLWSVPKDVDDENRSALSPVDIGADAGNFNTCAPANAGNDTIINKGNSITLGTLLPNNVSCSWVTSTGVPVSNANQPVVMPDSTTTYIVHTSSRTCVSADTIRVTVLPALSGSICSGGSLMFEAPGNYSFFQWQLNAGTGFGYITDDSLYSGTNTNTLQIRGITSSAYGYIYRCIANGAVIASYTIKFKNTWTGAINNLWRVPGNWSCNLVPDGNTDVLIDNGNVLLDQNGTCSSLQVVAPGTFTIQPGVTLTITR